MVVDPEQTNMDGSILRLDNLRWKSLDSDYLDASGPFPKKVDAV